MTALSAVFMILAVARVTRLVTTDVLFDGPRGAVVNWLIGDQTGSPSAGIRGKIAYLIVCDWCASVYVGAAGAGTWWAWGETMPFMVATAALASSYVTGFLASVTDQGD